MKDVELKTKSDQPVYRDFLYIDFKMVLAASSLGAQLK